MPPILQVLDIKLKTTICILVTLLSWVPVPRNEQIWAKSPNFIRECFAPSLIEIEWVIQKCFFKHCNWIFCFYTYLPFGKSIYPFIWTNLNLFHQRVNLCQVYLKLALCGSFEEINMSKLYRQKERQKDSKTWFSLGELIIK